MHFSIVVPVYNTAKFLPECIAALKSQDYPADQYEIIMVDNNSQDDSRRILEQAEGVDVLTETKQGSYAARNRGVSVARGKILAFTDSDCIPSRNWLRSIETGFEDAQIQIQLGSRRPRPDIGLIGLISDYEDNKVAVIIGSTEVQAYYAFTNNMAVWRRTLDQYGPFLERERGSETIFLRRVVDGEGFQVVAYVPSMRTVHAEMSSLMTYYWKTFTYGRSHCHYSQLVASRPLTKAECLRAFRLTMSARGSSLFRSALLQGVLAGNLMAWNLGRMLGFLEVFRRSLARVSQ